MQALRSGNPRLLGVSLVNDMQTAACSLAPVLRDTLQVGRDAGAWGALVSGSGPTVVFLARDADHAVDLSVALTACASVRGVRRARGPVPGARIGEPSRH
jgi:4-diphosphocytidyl-2-C-methyl-D-erythritol kinase